jgi:DNA repair exonuclease SbcCD ATPase subunit
MATRAQTVINEIIDVTDKFALLQIALRGEFASEIEQLKAARADLEAKQAYIGTVEEAAKLRADAEAYAAETRGKADADAATVRGLANDLAAAASAKVAGIQGRETAVNALQAQLDARGTKLDERESAIADAQTTKDAELKEREAAVIRKEKELAVAVSKLNDDRVAFNKRLEALRA